MTIKVLLVISMLLIPSVASNCNYNDSWMVGRNAMVLIADINNYNSDIGTWQNCIILDEKYGYILISYNINRLFSNETKTMWINKNFIWSIDL